MTDSAVVTRLPRRVRMDLRNSASARSLKVVLDNGHRMLKERSIAYRANCWQINRLLAMYFARANLVAC